MSRQANPTVVGTFVIMAIVIAVAAVLILGNIKLHDRSLTCVIYFQGSLHNLDIGAPVTFRGVQIGTVSDIMITFDRNESDYTIPVFVSIEPETSIMQAQIEGKAGNDPRRLFTELIQQGLRAKLKIRTLVTGKLYIDLGLYPDTPLRLKNPHSDTIEIPSLPSDLEQLTRSLENLPISELLATTASVLKGMDRLVNSRELEQLMADLARVLKNAAALSGDLERRVPELGDSLDKTLHRYTELAAELSALASDTRGTLSPALHAAVATLKQLEEVLASADSTLNTMQGSLGAHSPLQRQLNATLAEIERTARSLQQLSDYLTRHPETLIFGRQEDRQ